MQIATASQDGDVSVIPTTSVEALSSARQKNEVDFQRDEELAELKRRVTDCKGENRTSTTTTPESLAELWSLFLNLESSGIPKPLLADLIEVFSRTSNKHSEDIDKVVRLWRAWPRGVPHTELCLTIVEALLQAGHWLEAVKLHNTRLTTLPVGSSFPLTGTLASFFFERHQWSLLLTLWKSRLKHETGLVTGTLRSNHNLWCTAFCEGFKSIDSFRHAQSFLDYLTNSSATMDENHRAILIPFLEQLISTMSTSRTKSRVFMEDALPRLESLGLTSARMYEAACICMINFQKLDKKNGYSTTFRFFNTFRQSKCFHPGEGVLRALLNFAVARDDLGAVEMLLHDWQTHHPSLSATVTVQFMKFFAKYNNVPKVQGLFDIYVQSHEQADRRVVYPLLHAYALGGDTTSIRDTIKTMEREKGWTPDLTCWNILLNGYAKNDDLDGALSCTSDLMTSKTEPDHYTFGTIMSLCASRGDVELVEQFLTMASSHGIAKTAVMLDTQVLAYINNDDIKSAEVVAEEASINPTGISLTRAWTQIVAYYATRGDLAATVRTSRRMGELLVPFDSITYAALMRVFSARGRSTKALTILEDVMIKNKMKVSGIHYAIVIDGLAREYLFELAFRVQADMIKAGIKPTVSTKLALLRLQTLASRLKLTNDQATPPGVRADLPEEVLEEILSTSEEDMPITKTPELHSIPARAGSNLGPYFEILLGFYGKTKSLNTIKALLERYEHEAESKQDINHASMSMKMLASVMNMHYLQSNFDDVTRYWQLARTSALKMAKISSPLRNGKLPLVRRTLLAKPLDVLIKSLVAQDKLDELDTTLADLAQHGFEPDNENWNRRVQALATRDRPLDAFTLCERNLMQRWPGWQPREPKVRVWQAAGRKGPGLEFLGDKLTFLRPGQLQASYKTFVRLAHVFGRLKRDAPYDREKQSVLDEIRRLAPQTMTAVLTMPVQQHPRATHVLGARTGGEGRRRVSGRRQ